jgi:1-acyl-sn-glycerol-3-phosphate acyltransferase
VLFMGIFKTIFRTIISYLIIITAGLICVIPCVVVACLPKKIRYDNRFYYWVTYFFYRAVVFSTFVPVTITYEAPQELYDEAAIIISNHQSSLDIPLIGVVVKQHPHVWLFLSRYAKVPIFGFIVNRMNVAVDYKWLRKLVGSLSQTLDIINGRKSHIILFPEGGRYTDGNVHNFFYGFAILAKNSSRPVIPIILHDVYKAFPPGALFVRDHAIRVHVGKAFRYLPGEAEDEFVSRVYAWYQKNISGEAS